MRHLWMTGLLGITLAACTAGGDAPESDPQSEGVKAPIALTLTDGGADGVADGASGDWQIDIESLAPLSPTTKLYAFSRSENDYRSESWRVISGAVFERKAGFDTITLSAPRASFTFTPYSGPMQASYTPFINFSDGGTAVFLGQFDLFGQPDEDTLAAIKGDVTQNTTPLFAAPLTINSTRPMLYGGESYRDSLTVELDGKVSYAFLGDTPITTGESFSGIIDPGLPDWISARFDDDLTTVFDALAARWGFELADKATILLAFEGYEVEGISLTGGALPGHMIVMQLSGSRLREENPRVSSYLKWFFTHEAVHLFQKITGKSYAHPRFAWIGEGGANTMTSMIMVENDLAQDGYLATTYGQSLDLCVGALEGTTLEAAVRAGPEGNYDCGDIIGRMTDAALPNHDYFAFWNVFLDDLEDNFTDADYFATMRKLGADEGIVTRLEALTGATVTDARETLLALMDDVGITTEFVDGDLRAIAFPD